MACHWTLHCTDSKRFGHPPCSSSSTKSKLILIIYSLSTPLLLEVKFPLGTCTGQYKIPAGKKLYNWCYFLEIHISLVNWANVHSLHSVPTPKTCLNSILSSRCPKLTILSTRTALGGCTFSAADIRLWNSLPANVQFWKGYADLHISNKTHLFLDSLSPQAASTLSWIALLVFNRTHHGFG